MMRELAISSFPAPKNEEHSRANNYENENVVGVERTEMQKKDRTTREG